MRPALAEFVRRQLEDDSSEYGEAQAAPGGGDPGVDTSPSIKIRSFWPLAFTRGLFFRVRPGRV